MLLYVNVSTHLPLPLKSNVFNNGMAGYIVIYITGMFPIAKTTACLGGVCYPQCLWPSCDVAFRAGVHGA